MPHALPRARPKPQSTSRRLRKSEPKNGKLKGTIKLAADADKQAAIDAALAEEKVQHAIEGKQIVKQIVVPGKIVNLVVK